MLPRSGLSVRSAALWPRDCLSVSVQHLAQQGPASDQPWGSLHNALQPDLQLRCSSPGLRTQGQSCCSPSIPTSSPLDIPTFSSPQPCTDTALPISGLDSHSHGEHPFTPFEKLPFPAERSPSMCPSHCFPVDFLIHQELTLSCLG
uniref:Uncharacterized protein n=1 Tax=Gopherus evgoodei TaxID=1825980 RepID=A0A8C4VVF1_9SAUR